MVLGASTHLRLRKSTNSRFSKFVVLVIIMGKDQSRREAEKLRVGERGWGMGEWLKRSFWRSL